MTLYLTLIIIPAVLGMWAQLRVTSVYGKWKKVGSLGKITGSEAASAIMRKAGIHDVEIVEVKGHLTDHYDPISRRLALSTENYFGTSLAALGVSAHESGHAIQHKQGYAFLKFRSALIPITTIASHILPFIIMGGFFLHMFGLIKLGVIAYLILTVFQLVTLPVEFDASKRARKELLSLGILQSSETEGVVETLNAAGWTYVAAFIASLGNLIYFIFLSQRERD